MQTDHLNCSATSGFAATSAEVSGWTAEGRFFIEMTKLIVRDSRVTTVRLHHRVADGSILFVRLVHGSSQQGYQKSDPLPYETSCIAPPDPTGCWNFQLSRASLVTQSRREGLRK
jgi:hypothetical protein